MDKAIPRLERAIAQREKIAIHGDYDVDGITSTVILRRALEMLGGDVIHFLPERMRDGYGLQPAAIERLHAQGVRPHRLGRLRHPGRRGGPAGAGPRRRPDHHRPPRARRHAAVGARGDQSEAARLHLPRQVPGRCRRRAQGRPGALRSRRQEQVAARIRQDRRASARSPTSCRSSARTGSSPGTASRPSPRGRTRSGCARCSMPADSPARRSTAITSAS